MNQCGPGFRLYRQRLYKLREPKMDTLAPLKFLAKSNPAKIAIDDLASGKSITYKALIGLIKDRRQEIQEDQTKLILLEASDPIDFAISLFAAWEEKRAVFVVNPDLPADDIDSVEKNAKIAALPEQARLILLTSGSTGTPKGVVLSGKNILWNAEMITNLLHYTEEDIHLILLRLFHVDAILCQLVPALFSGGSVCIASEREPRRIEKFLEEKKVTQLYLAPSIWISLLASNAIPKGCRNRVTAALSTTSPISEPTLTKIADTFPKAKVVNLYGLSESTASVTAATFDREHPVNASVGKALEGVSIKVTPEGDLAFKGPNLFLGYVGENGFEAPKLTEEGYWLTGDLAEIREENAFITGRRKEMISVGGYKVFPQEIERILLNIKIIESCLVVPQPDIILGERLAVVVKPKKAVSMDELKSICINELEKRLPSWKIPQAYFIVKSIPLTDTGKPDRKQAAKMANSI
jgi:long-chain acyl-CoA synthetase